MTRVILILMAIVSISMSMAVKGDVTGGEKSSDVDLFQAIFKGDMDALDIALAQGANPNRIFGLGDEDWAMCYATTSGRELMLSKLLAAGGDVDLWNNGANPISARPITCAMLNSNFEAYRILKEASANLEAKLCNSCEGTGDRSIFYMALSSRNLDIATDLVNSVTLTENDIDLLHLVVAEFPMLRNETTESYMDVFVKKLADYGIEAEPRW